MQSRALGNSVSALGLGCAGDWTQHQARIWWATHCPTRS